MVFGLSCLLILLIVQTICEKYGENATEVFGWFLPIVMPTLSLIIGILIMDAIGKGIKFKIVDRFLFRVAFALSTFYLILVALTILLQPFAEKQPIEVIRQSNLWLGPLQGLVAALLGAFFVKKEKE